MRRRCPLRLLAASLIAAGLAALALVGCASTAPQPPADLQPLRLADVQAAAERPRFALVLGGGGLRGFAHIGVLRALDEAGLRPDLVVGSSVGALVGAAYASGLSAAEIAAETQQLRIASLVDWTLDAGGLMRGRHLAAWTQRLAKGQRIEQFPIRFAAVATDLQTESAVLIAHGAPGSAVQASTAVPGVTVPVAYAGGQLVDAGVASLVPVRFARALGAERVLAVDIYCPSPRAQSAAAPAVLQRVMQAQSCLLAAGEKAEADLLLEPVIALPSLAERDSWAQAMQAGYLAARAALPRLRQALQGGPG